MSGATTRGNVSRLCVVINWSFIMTYIGSSTRSPTDLPPLDSQDPDGSGAMRVVNGDPLSIIIELPSQEDMPREGQ